MTKHVLSAALCAVALAGCVHHPHGYFRAPDPERPQVTLSGDYPVVNQEPIVAVRRGSAPVVISWRLPSQGDLTFKRSGGIRILGRVKDYADGKYVPRKETDTRSNGAFNCALGDPSQSDKDPDPRAFTCRISQDIPRGLYAYEITVVDKSGNEKSADPTIMF